MSFQTTVREAENADVADIRRVASAAWHAVYDDILGEETVTELLEEGYAVDVVERMVELDDIGLFVADADGDVVGTASCGMTDPHGIGDLDLYIHPDYWGEGIGTQLLERGKDHLRELSIRKVRDEVLVENDIGNAFYRKHFEHVGQREEVFGGETYPVNVYELRL